MHNRIFVSWGHLWCSSSGYIESELTDVLAQTAYTSADQRWTIPGLHCHCCFVGPVLVQSCKKHNTTCTCTSDAPRYHGPPTHQTHAKSVCSNQDQKPFGLTCRVVLARCPCTQKSGLKSCCPGCLAFWATWRRLRRAVIMLQCRATPPLLPLTLHPSCWRATACSGESLCSLRECSCN